MYQPAKESALNCRNPREGLFSGPGFIFLPGLCDKSDLSTLRWLLTPVKGKAGILHWPQTSPATVTLVSSGRAAEVIMHFTHSCQAFRQGQARILISCWYARNQHQKTSCSPVLSTLGWPCHHAFSLSDLQGLLGSRHFQRGVIRVLCCGWQLSWVAFLHGGSTCIFRI